MCHKEGHGKKSKVSHIWLKEKFDRDNIKRRVVISLSISVLVISALSVSLADSSQSATALLGTTNRAELLSTNFIGFSKKNTPPLLIYLVVQLIFLIRRLELVNTLLIRASNAKVIVTSPAISN